MARGSRPLEAKDFSAALWEFLEHADGEPDRLAGLLREVPREAIIEFHREFKRARANLRASGRFRWLHLESSDDTFEDILSYIVGRGPAYYDSALADPQQVPRQASMDAVAFLGASGSVFWERFHEEIEHHTAIE